MKRMEKYERTVEKLHNDCIDLIDHNVRDCVKVNETYEVFYNGKSMTLSSEQLQKECVGRKIISKAKFETPYRLLSYKWNPKK